MYPLFEAIAIKNGIILNSKFHQLRYEKSYELLYKKSTTKQILQGITPPKKGLFKLRISYNDKNREFEFIKYITKPILTLKIIEDNIIDYSLKYQDRTALIRLYEQRATCEDILIVKDGFVTDSSYCNIIFFDGKSWFTPSTPLLKGTQREKLLQNKTIIETKITLKDIFDFKSFKLVNALRDFENTKSSSIKNIVI